MESPEVALYWQVIAQTIDQIVACLDDLSIDDLNWKPIPAGNSLAVLAVHTIASTEESIVGVFCGQEVAREREAEFRTITEDHATIIQRWSAVRARIEAALHVAPTTWLDQERHHPRRGRLTGREVLLGVASHTAEHLGHASLTRDLVRPATS